MADPFLGQIMLVAFNYPPQGWALCNGQLLKISTYAALYSLLGTVYGGDGIQSFALPDLRGRVPLGMGQGGNLSNYQIGQQIGSEGVALSVGQMPTHNHGFQVDMSAGSSSTPAGGNIALVNTGTLKAPMIAPSYTPGNPIMPAALNNSSVQNQGNSQSHPNIQPSLAMNYIIALQGIFPPRG